MYIPKSKYVVRPAKLDEFTNGYLGPVVETSTGKFFAGSSLETISTQLTLTQEAQPAERLRPFHEYIEPTEQDYEAGSYNRYFLQINKTKRVMEVSSSQFKEKFREEGVSGGFLTWRLVGSKNTINMENQKAIETLQKDIPALGAILKDPLQFVK